MRKLLFLLFALLAPWPALASQYYFTAQAVVVADVERPQGVRVADACRQLAPNIWNAAYCGKFSGGGGPPPPPPGGWTDNRITCNFFIAASGGSDSNPGTAASPFATVAHLQSILRSAQIGGKTGCFKAGTYNSFAVQFTPSDASEYWECDPASPLGSCILDNGNASAAFYVCNSPDCTGSPGPASTNNFPNTGGSSNLTINGFTIQNFQTYGIFLFSAPGSIAENNTVKNGGVAGSGIGSSAAISISIGVTVQHNYVTGIFGAGITAIAYNAGTKYDGSVIDSNVVLNTCQQLNDCGAINCGARNTNNSAGKLTVTNNFIRDYGSASTQAEGLYWDDDCSQVTATGNIVGPPVVGISSSVGNTLINGGDASTWSNNVIDLGATNWQFINAQTEQCGSGTCSGGNLGFTWTAGNTFKNNIVLSRYTGAFAGRACDGNGVSTVYCLAVPNPSFPWIGSISGNDYHNYGGGAEPSNSNFISDSSPVHTEPGCTGYLYNFSNLPAGFTDVAKARNAGPAGFVIPTSTNHSCT